jgi:carboxymethylenebutenolidase
MDYRHILERFQQQSGAEVPSPIVDEPIPSVPLVIVAHDESGLTDHVRRLVRRLALDVRVVCAIDLFSREGGSDHVVAAERRTLLDARGTELFLQDVRTAVEFYASQPHADADTLGMLGFGFGGGVAWRAAVALPALKSAVCYHGEAPPIDALSNARTPVLGIYSSDPADPANQGREELATAIEVGGFPHRIVVPPNTRAGFFDETGSTYNPLAAAMAWSHTSDWFRQHLRLKRDHPPVPAVP